MNIDLILANISDYYTAKLENYGPSAKGVDWKDESSQRTRFRQLLKLMPECSGFSVNDLGCGYGRLYEFMHEIGYIEFSYSGYDVSAQMVKEAVRRYSLDSCKFQVIRSLGDIGAAEYSLASGIFNVKLSVNDDDWLTYSLGVLHEMNRASSKGFAFNMLTKYSDRECIRDYLYYADPCFIFDICKQKYAKNVALLHDYDLYEFTILVKK